MLGFGPYSLDLGPKRDEALRMGEEGDVSMYGWMDGQIPPVFYRTLSPLGPLHHILLKQGTGTADHLLPLGCHCYLMLLVFLTMFDGRLLFGVK